MILNQMVAITQHMDRVGEQLLGLIDIISALVLVDRSSNDLRSRPSSFLGGSLVLFGGLLHLTATDRFASTLQFRCLEALRALPQTCKVVSH